jgi:hypothetical protein
LRNIYPMLAQRFCQHALWKVRKFHGVTSCGLKQRWMGIHGDLWPRVLKDDDEYLSVCIRMDARDICIDALQKLVL